MTVATAFERSLDLGTQAGLSEEEARLRLGQQGPNELPTQKRRNLLDIVLEVMREPMFIMLIVAGGLYLFLGDASEAVMLLGFVFVVVGITIIQSRRTERALDALRDLSSPRALVIRGGVHHRIPGREVVQGDFLVLAEGDRVPAEAADLVLLDDDFASIVVAIRLGRRIYDNIRKAIAFTFAVHVPIAGLSILPVFFVVGGVACPL